MPEIIEPTPSAMERAVATLRRGGLVAFPTETVYGLGGDADNPAAVAAIFRVKGRPSRHPLIVHLATSGMVDGWVAEVPAAAQSLIDAFWPGPLTLILRGGPRVHPSVTGGQATVGLRVPAHPVATALLSAFGGALAAPSANRFGRISPTRAEHVAGEFGDCDEPSIILDGGASEVGLESTIVDMSGPEPLLLRPGSVSASHIAEIAGIAVRAMPEPGSGPRAPGRLLSHYAPLTPTELHNPVSLERALEHSGRVGVLAITVPTRTEVVLWKQLPAEPVAAAHLLYSLLRELDAAGADAILIEEPPQSPAWDAVRDRVRKAAAPRSPVSGRHKQSSGVGGDAVVTEEEA